MSEKINTLRIIATVAFTILFWMDSDVFTSILRIAICLLIIVLSSINLGILISNQEIWWPEIIVITIHVIILARCVLLFVYVSQDGMVQLTQSFNINVA